MRKNSRFSSRPQIKKPAQGGLIGIDNTLWYGKVVDESQQDADTNAIRALNRWVHEDDRVDAAMIPISDGLTLVLKK